jgi:hypothetical protein
MEFEYCSTSLSAGLGAKAGKRRRTDRVRNGADQRAGKILCDVEAVIRGARVCEDTRRARSPKQMRVSTDLVLIKKCQ